MCTVAHGIVALRCTRRSRILTYAWTSWMRSPQSLAATGTNNDNSKQPAVLACLLPTDFVIVASVQHCPAVSLFCCCMAPFAEQILPEDSSQCTLEASCHACKSVQLRPESAFLAMQTLILEVSNQPVGWGWEVLHCHALPPTRCNARTTKGLKCLQPSSS